MVTEDVYAVGKQGRGYALALFGWHSLAFPEELDSLSLRLLENGVRGNPTGTNIYFTHALGSK